MINDHMQSLDLVGPFFEVLECWYILEVSIYLLMHWDFI